MTAKPLTRTELEVLRALAELHEDDPLARDTLRLIATIDAERERRLKLAFYMNAIARSLELRLEEER